MTYSIRCLSRQVSIANGHIHDLKLEHLVKEFTIEPGTVNEAQLTCADGYKGIVADWTSIPGWSASATTPVR